MKESTTNLNENKISVTSIISLFPYGKTQFKMFFLCGIFYAFVGMEVILFSYLVPVFEKEWKLSDFESAFILSSSFAGWLTGSLLTGWVSDRYGRRTCLLLGLLLSVICKSIMLVASNWLLVSFLIFVNCNGSISSNISFTLYTEILNTRIRIKSTMIFAIWWSLGSVLQVFFCWSTLENLNWRYCVLLHLSVGVILLALIVLFLRESIIYNNSKKKYYEATNDLLKMNREINSSGKRKEHKIEIDHKISQYLTQRIPQKEIQSFFNGLLKSKKSKKKFKDLFLILAGLNLDHDNLDQNAENFENDGQEANHSSNIDNEIVKKDELSEGSEDKAEEEEEEEDEEEKGLKEGYDSSTLLLDPKKTMKENGKRSNGQEPKLTILVSKGYRHLFICFTIAWISINFTYYGDIVLSPICFSTLNTKALNKYVLNIFQASSEIIFQLLTVVISKYFSRKYSIVCLLGFTVFGNLIVLFYQNNAVLFSIFLMIMRGSSFSIFMILILFTLECYPTLIRNRSLGVFSSLGRLFTLIVPYTVYNDQNLTFPLTLYLSISLLNVITVFQIKAKSKNKSLET
ncbi:major facilitator-type transporter hxnz-related [Anaeramoeba flamelloides]|uniref:Major facilitator-type transporter hxnz-related n=1 Tax=Anaeramoeba flamelloides TaxID=1746091 RepID=A0AAV7Z3A0_9EUKA|nr:major facilitator-type transporter hxnz-related [Anaeramoeba flamelloides]